ncbi:MAG: hypothetical protein Q9174_007086 [Haloplaca sp. 1 TL-2023]
MATPKEFRSLVKHIRSGNDYTPEQKARNVQIAIGSLVAGLPKIHLSHKILPIVHSSTCPSDLASTLHKIRGITAFVEDLPDRIQAFHLSSGGRDEAGLQQCLDVDVEDDPKQTRELLRKLDEWDHAGCVAVMKGRRQDYDILKQRVEVWYSLEKSLVAGTVEEDWVDEEKAVKECAAVALGSMCGRAFGTGAAR